MRIHKQAAAKDGAAWAAMRKDAATQLLLPSRFALEKIQISSKWGFTNGVPCAILYLVRGALAQLVAHNTGSVGVRSSSLLCSTILEKSELNPGWGWVRISSFYLKYCGVISKTNERRRIGIIPIVAVSTL